MPNAKREELETQVFELIIKRELIRKKDGQTITNPVPVQVQRPKQP